MGPLSKGEGPPVVKCFLLPLCLISSPNVLGADIAAAGLLKDQGETKQQVLAKVEELLEGIKELLQAMQVS